MSQTKRGHQSSKDSHAKRNVGVKKNTRPTTVQWRFILVLSLVCLVFSGLVVRAAYIQVIDPDMLIKKGDSRTERVRKTKVHRGLILDRNGEELAVSVPVRAVWADPKTIHNRQGFKSNKRWKALADVLDQDLDRLLKRVDNPDKRFVYLQRQVTPAMADYVAKLKIPGVYLRDESRRYYPSGEVSAHLIGFTDVDDHGLEGIEKIFEDILSGTPDSRAVSIDAKGRQVELHSEEVGKKPRNIQLTIDQRIQALAYKEVKRAVSLLQATSGSAVVANVHTGEILALVNSPSFNPNNRKGVAAHKIRNRAITDTFEPGSSVKPLAVVSALEFGSADLETVIDTSPGWMRIGGAYVRDPRNYGQLDLADIVKHSSNMGTSKLAFSMPKQQFLDTYYEVGLIGDTGTNLLGESGGIFHERSRWSDHELATLSFGYGIAVTTLQLARMYTTLANGGIRRPLSIIKNDELAEGERAISANTAAAVVEMMEHVVSDSGTGKKAQVPGYRVAGKTGTSRKAVPGGYGEEYVNIFAGLAPVSEPQVAIVILINEPGGDLYHSGDTAAPVFARVMSGTLQMLNIPPDDKSVSSLAAIRSANNGS